MYNFNAISPYIHFAHHSYLSAFNVRNRIIFDYELILIEKGEWIFIYEGKSYTVRENDIILICPGAVHEMRKSGSHSVKQPHIHFDLEYDEKNPDVKINYKIPSEMTKSELSNIRKNIFGYAENFLPVFNVKDIAYFKHLFFDIIDNYLAKPYLYELSCKSKMIELLRYIFAECRFWSEPEEQTSCGSIPLDDVHRFISKNFFENINRIEIARKYKYNPTYLDRRFKQKYGLTPMEYYHSLRINEIKRLLKSGTGCGDIVNIFSFSCASSFSRYFKERSGISAAEYRKSK